MAKLQKAKLSDRTIDLTTYNNMVDAAGIVLHDSGQRRTKGKRHGATLQQTFIVGVKNNTGAAVDAFGVVELGDILIDPDGGDSQLGAFRDVHLLDYFLAEEPTASPKKIVIVQGVFPDESLRRAVAIGHTKCKVDITDTGHKYAKAETGTTTHLVSTGNRGEAHAKIWHPNPATGEGVQWAMVQLLDDAVSSIRTAALTAVLLPGTSAAATWVEWDSVLEIYVASEETVTIYDRKDRNFGRICDWIDVVQDSASGRWECVGSQGLTQFGITQEDIVADGSGTVRLVNDQAGNIDVTAHLDWMNNGDALAISTEVEVRYDHSARESQGVESGYPCDSKGRWVFTNSECEATGSS